MDRESVENLSRLEKESSIERNLLRMCREAIELEERRFFKEKLIEMNATNKLLKQTSKTHVKLSNLILTYMHIIHISKTTHTHTHTHTHNKSNQFYISKTSQNSLVSIY